MTSNTNCGGILGDQGSIAEVCRRYRVRNLAIFGSAARGELRPDSDIDLMVEFEAGARVGLIQFERLSEDLSALSGRKVDLVTRRGLKPWVLPQVLRDAQIVYAA